MHRKLLIISAMALLVAEIVFSFNTQIGFLVYAVFLAAMLYSLSRERYDDDFRIVSVLLVLPILRISEIFLDISFLWRTMVFYLLFLLLIIFYTEKLDINVGYHLNRIKLLPLAIIIGGVFGFLGSYVFGITGRSEILYFIPVIAFCEEVFFRGIVQKLVQKNDGVLIGVLFSAIIYAIFSFGYGLSYAALFFLYSMVIGIFYSKSDNIYLVTIANLVFNVLLIAL